MLYEIANEPNGVSWASIKSYAEEVIPVIRQRDPDSVIIVGTRGWSSLGVSEGSGPAEIAANPVNASNIMYAFHFYAASHRDNYLNALREASELFPVFVTEFGTETYTGDGANDFQMADALHRPDGGTRRSGGPSGTTRTTSVPARSSSRAPARPAARGAVRR